MVLEAFEAGTILIGALAVLVVLRLPIGIALGLAAVPVFVLSEELTINRLIVEMFKSYDSMILIAVPLFVLAGNVMNSAGVARRLIRLSRALVGFLPGGPGQVNVSANLMFAGVSGPSPSGAAQLGAVMIPAMLRRGHRMSASVAVTACSSVLIAIGPPSVLMVIWGGSLSVPVGQLFLASVVPVFLITGSIMAAVMGIAAVRQCPGCRQVSIAEPWNAFKSAGLALATPLIVIGGIVSGFVNVTEAALISVIYALVLALFVYRSLSLFELTGVLTDSARFAANSLFVIGTASVFSYLLMHFQIGRALTSHIETMALSAGIVAIGVVVCFLLAGIFIDAIPAVIILGTLLWPMAQEAGMHQVHFAIIGVVSLAFGSVMPPHGLSFTIACVVGQVQKGDVIRDTMIVLVPMLTVLVSLALLPQVILWLPKLLIPAMM